MLHWIAIFTLLSISLITPKPSLKVTSMRQRILYHAVQLGLEMLEAQLNAADAHYQQIEGSGWDDEDPDVSQYMNWVLTEAMHKAACRVLHDRYGPFDAVAGQRDPWERIP